MMPGRRRRRKSVEARRPTLKFTESPVSVKRNLPSPVFANDDPPTADVVPIDEDTSLISWVSPQFNQITATVRRTRKVKSMLNNDTRMVTRARKRHFSAKENNTSYAPHNPAFKPLRFLGEASPDQGSITHTEVIPHKSEQNTSKHSKKKSKQSETPLRNMLNDLSGPQTPTYDEQYDNVESPNRATQRLPKQNNPVKRLFASVSGELHSPNHTKPSDITVQLCNPLHDKCDSDVSLRLSQGFSLTQHSSSSCSPLRVCRRSHRLNLFSTPTRRLGSDYKVLVKDTPEEEYGLSLNERRLKSLRLNSVHR